MLNHEFSNVNTHIGDFENSPYWNFETHLPQLWYEKNLAPGILPYGCLGTSQRCCWKVSDVTSLYGRLANSQERRWKVPTTKLLYGCRWSNGNIAIRSPPACGYMVAITKSTSQCYHIQFNVIGQQYQQKGDPDGYSSNDFTTYYTSEYYKH